MEEADEAIVGLVQPQESHRCNDGRLHDFCRRLRHPGGVSYEETATEKCPPDTWDRPS